jgi:hypothetical protein
MQRRHGLMKMRKKYWKEKFEKGAEGSNWTDSSVALGQ